MSANPKPTPISQKSGSFLGQNSSTVSPQTNKQVPSQSSQSKPTQTILKSQSIGNIPKESNTIVKSASSPSFSSNDNTLPPDWTEYKDDGGYSYFYNDKTGVTQWERPSMPKPQETQAPLSPVPQRPNKSLPPPPNKSLPPAPAKSSPQLPPRNPAQIPAKSQNSSPQIPINNTKSNSASNIPRIPPKSPEPVNLHVATSPLTARRTTQSATTSTSGNRPPSLPAPLKTEPPVPLPRTFSPPPVRNNAPVKLPELSKSPPLNRQSAILPASSPSHGSLPNRSSTIIDSNYKKAPALPEKPTTNSSAPVVPPKVFPQKEVVAQGNRPVPVPMKSTGRPPTVVQPQNSPQKTAVVPAKQLPPTPAAKPARVPAKATRSNNLPPAPPPKKPELSALLQNGQQQQGSAAQIGVCPKCNQALFHGEPKVSAKGKMWHKNCFVCNSCNLPFTESFTTVAGNPYHIKCVCAKCKVPFKTGEHKMSAQGMMWHRSCFVCTHCGNPFTSTFTTKNGKVYHVECWVAVSESGQPAPSTPSQQPSQAPVIRESSKFKDVMGKAKEKLGVFGEKAHEKLELFGEKAQELAKEKYAFLKAKRAEQKKKAEENRKISEEQKKLTEQQKEEQRKVQEQQREEQRKVQEAKKEEQRKKAQMKKEQQRKTLEQKKEEKARKQQAKQKDKELRNAKGKQSVAFNGVLVKAVVDQIGSDSDEILTFELDALFHLTDVKFGGDNTNKVGGGTGLFLGYNNGRQGFVPVHCVEVIAPPKVEDYAPLFKNLLQIIVAPDLSIALSLCSVFPREEQTLLSKALVPLFESNGHILDLIEVLIENEIAQTTDPATLFRNNSIASAVMTNYFFAIGKDYLRGILVPLIEEVTKLDYSVELDPAKAGGQDVSQNAANLRLISQKFFDTITGSVSVCPAPIKNICYLLATEVSKKFPQHKHVVVGGFVFLRAFSPAVVSPEGFQLVTELDAKSRRPLVLISKLLQNVSNGKEFKEEYMHSVNSFVSDNLPKAEAFFDQLSATYYDNAVVPKNTPLLDCIDMEALHKFHYQINMHLSKIGKELELMTELTQNLEEYPYDQFLALLHELGPPKGSIPADEKKEEKKKDQAKTNPQEKKPEPLKRSSTEIQRPPPASASSDNHDLVRMFGIPVGECKLDSSQPVPFVLELCINYLESYALREEGILRLAGNNTEVKELRAELERGQTPDFSKCSDIHSVGALLKIFLRELPKPLFQVSKETTRIFYFMYPLISQVVQDSEDMVELLQSDLSDLPEINFQATKRLFGFLKKIVGNAEVNKMSAENIAVVLQPTVHLPHDIIVAMIANYEALFMPASSEETTQNTGNYWEDQSYWSEVQKSVDETFENTEQPEYTFEEAYVEEMTEESGYELSESQEMDTQMEQEEEYQEQEENV